MYDKELDVRFRSILGKHMQSFINEKRACGYRYFSETKRLKRFDQFISKTGLTTIELPKHLAEEWIAKRPHESSRTQQQRIETIRQFSRYLRRMGLHAYAPDMKMIPINHIDFTPYIFSHDEIHRIIEASDSLSQTYISPLRHLTIPLIFRLLYGCGMRLGEVLRLKVADVNLETAIITVREGKFRKDRLVPVAASITERMQKYATIVNEHNPKAFFFPARDGGRNSQNTVYTYFRQFLRTCSIPHRGRGKGPRVHDIRHTFAVHCLERWYREGADLGAMLPVLATYLGHQGLAGTQRYLRLTPDIFPDIIAQLEESVGCVIPRRTDS